MIETFLQDLFAGEKDAVVTAMAAYFLLMCGWSLIGQIWVRRWPSTRGELLSQEVSEFGASEIQVANRDYVGKAKYRYYVDGREYEGTRISPWIIVASHNARAVLEAQLRGINKLPDGGVEVIYNPRKPQKSYLIKPGFFGMGVTVAIGVLPLIYWL